MHALVWEEAQLLSGLDPDFHRRDLADAIESGVLPQWDLGVQVMPDTAEETFEGIDLLDPTKLVPEELCPVQVIGTMTLIANPSNYFAETEQVAFHVGNLVPGIDVTNDPLLQVRLFSYIDTQLSRLGGPNFNQLPINRTHAPVNDMLRDGMHQGAIHEGIAPYSPNSLDGGCPFTSAEGAFIDVPQAIAASERGRETPASFEDHYSQPAMFYRSLTPVERDHVIAAYTFELSRCLKAEVRERQLGQLGRIDEGLAAAVAEGLGLPAPSSEPDRAGLEASPALSMVGGTWPIAGRQVGVVADSSGARALDGVLDALAGLGLAPVLITPTGDVGDEHVHNRSWANATSVELDALLVATEAAPARDAAAARDAKAATPGGEPSVDPRIAKLLGEAWRHCKPIAALSAAKSVLSGSGVPVGGAGVSVGDAEALASFLLSLIHI